MGNDCWEYNTYCLYSLLTYCLSVYYIYNILQSRSACFKTLHWPVVLYQHLSSREAAKRGKGRFLQNSHTNWASFSTENRLQGGDTAGHKEKGVLQVFFEMDEILT